MELKFKKKLKYRRHSRDLLATKNLLAIYLSLQSFSVTYRQYGRLEVTSLRRGYHKASSLEVITAVRLLIFLLPV